MSMGSIPERLAVRAMRLRHRYPPLFIVGVPRSGTTLVTQYVLNNCEFAFFPNLARSHPHGCVLAGWVAARRYEFVPGYESEYGIIQGQGAPSDGWEIFHRWFPRYNHAEPVRSDQLYELRNIVALYERIYHAPFANKNNANGPRIGHLGRLFPDAFWIRVQRDPADTVASVMEARRKNGVATDDWWGVAPPQFHARSFRSELQRVAYQVWGTDQSIAEGISAVPAARQKTATYESFCEAPGELLSWLTQVYAEAGVVLRRRDNAPPERFSARMNESSERRALREQVATFFDDARKENDAQR